MLRMLGISQINFKFMKILSPNETIEMLGTKDEFKKGQCKYCDYREDCSDEYEEDDMEENNKLDLMESQQADCKDLE